jgi:hypothetical protein
VRLQDDLRAEAARLRDASAFTDRVGMKLQYLREASLFERAAAALDVCGYVDAETIDLTEPSSIATPTGSRSARRKPLRAEPERTT